jgi:outer membrane immunogenic protein
MKKLAIVIAVAGLVGTPAFAADMAVKAPPQPLPPPCIWCGFYAGINLGGDWANNHNVGTIAAPLQGFSDGIGAGSYAANSAAAATGIVTTGNNASFIGGVQIGYNWGSPGQSWLVGVEADIQGVGQNDKVGILNTVTAPFGFIGATEVINGQIASAERLNYLGTVRGRIGFLATPTFLLYGTAGFAYGGVKASTAITQTNNDCAPGNFPGDCITTNAAAFGAFSQTRFGGTAGVGGEWMFAPNWSAKAEYLYYDLGGVSYGNGLLVTGVGTGCCGGPAIVSSISTAKFTGNIARVGVNYHFGGLALGGY